MSNGHETMFEYDVPDEVFMVKELQDGSLNVPSGTVKHH